MPIVKSVQKFQTETDRLFVCSTEGYSFDEKSDGGDLFCQLCAKTVDSGESGD
jgi:hypothetical protein